MPYNSRGRLSLPNLHREDYATFVRNCQELQLAANVRVRLAPPMIFAEDSFPGRGRPLQSNVSNLSSCVTPVKTRSDAGVGYRRASMLLSILLLCEGWASSTYSQVQMAQGPKQFGPFSSTRNEHTVAPNLEPRSGTTNLDLRGDTKAVYEQLANAFEIHVVFDPDLTVRNVRVRADDVDFYAGVALLEAETETLWRPLNAKLMLVAPDTPEKRRQYAMEVEQTFPLKGAASPEEMTEILRALRDITGATHVQLDSWSGSITIRDTPEKLAVAGELLRDLDQLHGEVMVDIRLLEVDHDKARQLGMNTPASTRLIPLTPSDLAKLKSSTDLGNLLTNLEAILAAKGISDISVIPVGGGRSILLLTAPGAALNLSDSSSVIQSAQQVLLRAQDGKPAAFFVGTRYPVTLSQLSSSTPGNSGTSTPSGTTFPETRFAVGKNPSALVANTFTGGTLPDLAVVNRDDNSITILQNEDNGNFVETSSSPIALGKNETSPVAIASGIFRNDSAKFSTPQPADLVVVNSGSNNISIHLGEVDSNGIANGSFTEAPTSPITVGTSPSAVVVADFNGDGFLDVAVANQGDNSISVFRGKGDGTFAEFPTSPFKLKNTGSTFEQAPITMVSANFQNKTLDTDNGANEVDLAIVNQVSNNVTILLGSIDDNQNVIFTEAAGSPIEVGNSPVAVASGDLNADGVPDLAIVNQADNSLTVLLASANLDATFSAAQGSPLQTPSKPAGIVIANFANGAVPDLAVTDEAVNTLAVYVGQGQGTFSSPIELDAPISPTALITSVLSSSGLPDVALVGKDSSGGGVVAVILNSSSFANNNSNGGQPYPGAGFVDLGIKVKAIPKLHAEREVTLQIELEIRALSGTTLNGIPVISNETLNETVRLKEDEPAILGVLKSMESTGSITGWPRLAEIPGAGYAFGTRNNSAQGTELLILVTPHRLRSADRVSRPIYAGRGDPRATSSIDHGSPAPADLPPPGTLPPPSITPTPQPTQPKP